MQRYSMLNAQERFVVSAECECFISRARAVADVRVGPLLEQKRDHLGAPGEARGRERGPAALLLADLEVAVVVDPVTSWGDGDGIAKQPSDDNEEQHNNQAVYVQTHRLRCCRSVDQAVGKSSRRAANRP